MRDTPISARAHGQRCWSRVGLRIGSLLLAALALVAVLAGPAAPRADAALNKQVNFQGRLTDPAGIAVPDGSYNLEFKLHNDPTLAGGTQGQCAVGSCLWMETRTLLNRVTVTRGLFSVQLGSVSALSTFDFDQDPLYLSIRVGGTADTPAWDGEMTPRQRLAAAPIAIHSANSSLLEGRNGAYYLNSANLAGTLSDARLSTNVALRNANNNFSVGQSITGTLTATDLTCADCINVGDLAVGSVGTSELVDDSVASADIAADTIVAADIAPGGVASSEILDNSITSADIAANTIVAADIAAGAITSTEINDGSITTADILANTIVAADIAAGAITSTEISDGTIALGDIASGASGVWNSVNGAGVTVPAASAANTGHLFLDTDDNGGTLYRSNGTAWIKAAGSAGSTATDLACTGCVNSVDILDATITSTDVAADTITSGNIALDTIVAADIATGGVGSAEIGDGTVAYADRAPATFVEVTHTAAQSIAAGTNVPINFNVEDSDAQGIYSTTNFTVPAGQGGVYALTAEITYEPVSGGSRYAVITKNGATACHGVQHGAPSLAVVVDCNEITTLAAGDVIQVIARTTGTAVTLNVARMSMYRLS